MITIKQILAGSILVVDDKEANVLLLKRLLEGNGHTNVETTLRSDEVAALHATHAYDLILLDLQMPGMNGFAVMNQLRNQITSGYLPVIALTAEPRHKLEALRAGARDFISKPFDSIELRTRIHNMLEVRLLYKRLEQNQSLLERTVLERTAELRASEARYRNLIELATDWYWEQDATGAFTKVSGPIAEVLEPLHDAEWDPRERRSLLDKVAARIPFVNLALTRADEKGVRQRFLVSGEPIFDTHCRFAGFRGVGVDISQSH
jgi:CheY-like chemotaxis protein